MKFLSNLPVFIKFALSEDEKRFLWVFFLAIIIIILIFGVIGYIIRKVIRKQGDKLERAVYDAVTTGVVADEKHFKKYARKKNIQIFYRDMWIPIIILLISALVLVVHGFITNNFAYNPFNKDDGFGTLIWLWDFSNPTYYNTFFGIKLLSSWPDPINTPHLVAEAWAGYASVPLFIIGAFWYILVVQGLFARWLKIKQIIKVTYKKDLSTFNATTGTFNPPPSNTEAK